MEFFVLLAENGGDLESKDKNGWTPLHFATHDDRLNIVQYLLDHRVDFNAQTISILTKFIAFQFFNLNS